MRVDQGEGETYKMPPIHVPINDFRIATEVYEESSSFSDGDGSSLIINTDISQDNCVPSFEVSEIDDECDYLEFIPDNVYYDSNDEQEDDQSSTSSTSVTDSMLDSLLLKMPESYLYREMMMACKRGSNVHTSLLEMYKNGDFEQVIGAKRNRTERGANNLLMNHGRHSSLRELIER